MFRALRLMLPPLIALSMATSAKGLTVQEKLWVTDGFVNAVAYGDNVLYLGGLFSRVGPPVGAAARMDAATGAVLEPYPQVTGRVFAIAPDGAGGWFLGGSFRSVAGQPRDNLAHIDGTGNLTEWNPGTNGDVLALALSGSTLYAGGRFTSAGGQVRSRIAALDTGAGMATGWDPGADGDVHALAVYGGTVYAGGDFNGIGGQARSHVAALNASGSATSFNPGADHSVRALAVGALNVFPFTVTVYMGGYFTFVGGQSRPYIAAVDGTTGGLSSWNPGADAAVFALVITAGNLQGSGRTLYAGGGFQQMGGLPRGGLAALDASSGAVTSWNPSVSEVAVYALAFGPGGLLYVGGGFTSVVGQPRSYLAALDRATGSLASWNPGANGIVMALGPGADAVLAGGLFTSVGGVSRSNLAALDLTSGEATSWDPGANGQVWTLLRSGNTIFAGGSFTIVGGQVRSQVAALDAFSGVATGWNPDVSGPVLALAAYGNTIYIGGMFQYVGEQARANLAAIDRTTGAVLGFSPTTNGTVYALGVGAEDVFPFTIRVYAGGVFTSIDGIGRARIAAVDGTSGAVLSWNPGADQAVYALLVTSGDPFGRNRSVYAGGEFTLIGGQWRSKIALIDAAGAATSWDASANGAVRALGFGPGTIYAGGNFTWISGQPRGFLAELDATGAATSWDPGAAIWYDDTLNGVYTVARAGTTIYAGGRYSEILGTPHASIAGISDGSVTAVTDPAAPPAPHFLRASPNPFSGGTQMRLRLPESAEAYIGVFDVSGRRVRLLHRGSWTGGERAVDWDGRDDTGRPVPSGVYLLRARAGGVTLRSKLLRVR